MSTETVRQEQSHAERNRRIDVLIEVYRQSRDEGLRLVHSMFRDMTVILVIITAIVAGNFAFEQVKFLLILPIFLGVYGIFVIGKFRVNSLVTSYMIYLEQLINKELSKKLIIWNTVIISEGVSAGRKSTWGWTMLVLALLFCTILCFGITYWIITLNEAYVAQNVVLRNIYLSVIVVIYAISLFQLCSALVTIKRFNPKYMKALARQSIPR